MASSYLKQTTRLTGLAVAKNPRHTLGVLYSKILRSCSKMPEDAAYRRYTESIVQQRLKLVDEVKNVEELEKKIGSGQIEEVIVQAENEVMLARKMLEWKPWEPLLRDPPANQWKWPI